MHTVVGVGVGQSDKGETRMFRPKKGLLTPEGYNYEDTLENFLKLKPKKKTQTEAKDRQKKK